MKLGIAVAFSILAVLPALAGPAVLITGDYLEARSNHVLTCGCLFSGEMVTDGREAILAWKFDGGSYQGALLEGVKVVAVLNGPGMLSLPEDAHLGSFFSYEPFIPLADRTLAMTLLYEYQGGDFGVRWWRWEPGITGYFGRFQLQR